MDRIVDLAGSVARELVAIGKLFVVYLVTGKRRG